MALAQCFLDSIACDIIYLFIYFICFLVLHTMYFIYMYIFVACFQRTSNAIEINTVTVSSSTLM